MTAVHARPYAVAADEPARLAALATYDLVDGPPEPDLDVVAALAADLCGTPRAVVNIIAERHQHQVAAAGLDPGVCARGDSMCAVTILEPEPVVVADASRDPRFAANPFVTGAIDSVRFYAASQLRVRGGHVLGTLCAFDTVPRELTPGQRAGLDRLARMVVDVIELRRHSRLLQETLALREELLRELVDTQADLVRSNEALRLFATQVSHDLKNPLTGVLGSLSCLRDIPAVAADPDARYLLDRAESSGDRMQQMIDQVLGAAGPTPRDAAAAGEPPPVSLNQVVADALADLGEAVRDADADIEVGPLPTVRANATELRIVAQNLLGNALKYRHPQRPCRIRVRRAVDAVGHGLQVVDNGRGIPADQRHRVRELFTRLHTDVAGTGVGLATCQRVVARHRGRLVIGETPGGGTTVTVTLPR
ncbi:MAG TPA: GAF domain-containing sensor histidine kinase [Pilimelia sp.]|nr:GAF domain-containing sensor histidine kinase [Pilimelia sp.]